MYCVYSFPNSGMLYTRRGEVDQWYACSTHDDKLVGSVEMLQYSYPIFHMLNMDLLSA